MQLSTKIKLDILNAVLSENDAFGIESESNNVVFFLNSFMNLYEMPSFDDRFQNAYQDAYQHLINNDDWNYEYVFTERFNIIDDDNLFFKFINQIFNPNLRGNEDSVMKYYLIINPYLEREGFNLVIVDYHNNIPIYQIKKYHEEKKIPIGLKENNIPFIVELTPKGRGQYQASYDMPTIFPCFVLVPNKSWNDFSVISDYYLHFHNNETTYYYLGFLKIIHIKELKTYEIIPNSFMILDSDFCSLGQSFQYYNNLKKIFPNEFESVLWALKDSAFFPDIQEKFEHSSNFKDSVIRTDDAERLLRIVKYQIYGYDINDLYSFKYSFKAKFIENKLDIDFKFNNTELIPSRIIAFIGKNGTGKTQLVTNLPIDIYNKNDNNFTPKTPLFSKVIAVSYGAFDNFEIPKKTANFNYLYCGLRNEKGELYTNQGLKLRFHHSWKKIKFQNRFNKWANILSNFIDIQFLNQFIVPDENDINDYTVDIEKFNKIHNKLSSGQSIILYIITEIIANIRFDSLLIYDEPETHLHPNAISQLINTIYELVTEFQSYCVIATHSPLIIRELLSKNVYVIERENNFLSVRKPSIETFGENLTVLTDEVFGNREIPKHFKKILDKLVKDGKTFEEILSLLESDNVPFNLNVKIYLKSILNEKFNPL